MSSDSKTNKFDWQRFAHIVASIVILLHGYEKWLHHSATCWIFFLFGLLALILVANHKKLHHRYPAIDAVFFLIEGMLMFVTAYYYFSHGKQYLHYPYIFAGTLYLILIFVKHRSVSKGKS